MIRIKRTSRSFCSDKSELYVDAFSFLLRAKVDGCGAAQRSTKGSYLEIRFSILMLYLYFCYTVAVPPPVLLYDCLNFVYFHNTETTLCFPECLNFHMLDVFLYCRAVSLCFCRCCVIHTAAGTLLYRLYTLQLSTARSPDAANKILFFCRRESSKN